MQSMKPDVPPDARIGGGVRPKTKVESILEKIAQKQREIRSLENELDRTDINELAEENHSENEIQRPD